MKLKILLLQFLCIVLVQSLVAQDIHFSQFHLSPLTYNPANTGNFLGTYRLGGIYRDQYGSILGNSFQTPSAYVDANIPIFGKNSKHWIGVGVAALNDRSGSYLLNRTSGLASLAMHLGIANNTYLSFGGQFGYTQTNIDRNALRFYDEIQGGLPQGSSADLVNLIQNSINYPDLNVGVNLRTKFADKIDFYIGGGVFHLLETKSLYENNNQTYTALRYNGNLGLGFDLTQRIRFSPAVSYSTMEEASELVLLAPFDIFTDANRSVAFRIGPGYRLNDALIAMAGLNFNNFQLGVSYDFTTSSLQQIGGNAFEIGLQYIGKIQNTVITDPVLFCPRF